MSEKIETGELALAKTMRALSPEAQRALAEAAARRGALEARENELAETREINGRTGPDPVRYTDWEVRGIATDF